MVTEVTFLWYYCNEHLAHLLAMEVAYNLRGASGGQTVTKIVYTTSLAVWIFFV